MCTVTMKLMYKNVFDLMGVVKRMRAEIQQWNKHLLHLSSEIELEWSPFMDSKYSLITTIEGDPEGIDIDLQDVAKMLAQVIHDFASSSTDKVTHVVVWGDEKFHAN